MFIEVAYNLGNGDTTKGADPLFQAHPLILTALLECAWKYRAVMVDTQKKPKVEMGHPAYRSNLSAITEIAENWSGPLEPNRDLSKEALKVWMDGDSESQSIIDSIFHPSRQTRRVASDYAEKKRGLWWRHLIYAYMIENTGIYEIFRRVLQEFVYGEKLGVPEPPAQRWLRSTEELFYRDPVPFSIMSITSHIRPDMAATRRNAYQRMFGMGLNHGDDNSKPFYPYVPYLKAEAANTGFVSTFEEFLREVWVGIQNYKNKSGTNPTDDAKIADLAKALHDMLITRRQHGNLSREEFVFVSMMEWFHLTVNFNSPIVETLRADASDPAQRLFKIAERVGVPAHKDSRSYFALATPMAWLLLLIETGILNNANVAPALYTPPPSGKGLNATMETIINHWSLISPRDIKARPVTAR